MEQVLEKEKIEQKEVKNKTKHLKILGITFW